MRQGCGRLRVLVKYFTFPFWSQPPTRFEKQGEDRPFPTPLH